MPWQQRQQTTFGNALNTAEPACQKRGILLLSLALVQPHFEYMGFWAPQYENDVKIHESVQRRTRNLVNGLEGVSCEKLRTLWLSNVEKRRLRGKPITLCSSKGKQREVVASAPYKWLQDTQELLKAAPGEVQTVQEKCIYCGQILR